MQCSHLRGGHRSDLLIVIHYDDIIVLIPHLA